mmetsp:Transcript_23259/g.32866  ORF Transcript_23259/g.32866 Transcript_23259/m.32866 type:complete len:116 (+) Transcript_23259:165-512(+)
MIGFPLFIKLLRTFQKSQQHLTEYHRLIMKRCPFSVPGCAKRQMTSPRYTEPVYGFELSEVTCSVLQAATEERITGSSLSGKALRQPSRPETPGRSESEQSLSAESRYRSPTSGG